MERDNEKCDFALLSRFYDREAAPEEEAGIVRHLAHCSSCRKALQDHEAVSALFKAEIEAELARAGVEKVEESVMAVIHGEKAPWWQRYKAPWMSRAFFVPAAAVAVLFVVVFSLFRPPASVPGPSAIVDSVKGDISSVMILETEKSRQTVVWFNEVTFPGSENGEQESEAEFKPVASSVSIA